MSEERERTLILLKPDAVQRGLVGAMIQRFEQKGFILVAMKMTVASEEVIKQHYNDITDKPFFPRFLKYVTSSPLVVMVWEGVNVTKMCRTMLGVSNPAACFPGQIRGDYAVFAGRKVIGSSDDSNSAEREIPLWFKENELVNWTPNSTEWTHGVN